MLRFEDTERAELKAAFEKTHHRKVHIVYLRSVGVPRKEVASLFLVSLTTITPYCKVYKVQGIEGLMATHYKGRSCRVSASQQEDMEQFLEEHYVQGKGLQAYLKEHVGRSYSRSGALRLAHRLGYVSKKRNGYLGKPIPRSSRLL
jgi:transposase